MGIVRTVTGDIDASALGWCQCHEHLYLEDGKSYEINPALRMDDAKLSLDEITAYGEAGGNAFVDAQPVWAGRMAERMADASKKSGVSIIASTGYHKTCFYAEDAPVFTETAEALHRAFVADIEEGMLSSVKTGTYRTDAKAGMVKIAADKGGIHADAVYDKLVDAALQAASDTGLQVMAHFEPGADVFELIREMERKGLSPDHLIACHLDRVRPDAAYINEVAASGAFLDFDTVHRYRYHGDAEEIELISAVWKENHGDKLMLSLDTTAERLRSYGGEPGLDHILTTFRNLLQEAGIGETELNQMMVSNPAEAIAIK